MNLTIFETTWRQGKYYGHFLLKKNPYDPNGIVAILTDEDDDDPTFFYLDAEREEETLALAKKDLKGETFDALFYFLADNDTLTNSDNEYDEEEDLPL